MYTILIIIHVLVAIALILIVLLQTGKGASMGAAFGGGSSGTVFGSRGPAGFLSKITAVAAIVFMFTCLGLNIANTGRLGGDSVMQTVTPTQEQTAPPAETQQPPAPTGEEIPAEQAKPIPSDSGEAK
jgi:preprotein translocase subunit SecG